MARREVLAGPVGVSGAGRGHEGTTRQPNNQSQVLVFRKITKGCVYISESPHNCPIISRYFFAFYLNILSIKLNVKKIFIIYFLLHKMKLSCKELSVAGTG